jgi:hypothetical protein
MIRKKKEKPKEWAQLAARSIAKDGKKNGWPTTDYNSVVLVTWAKMIEEALNFSKSKLWKDLGLPKQK